MDLDRIAVRIAGVGRLPILGYLRYSSKSLRGQRIVETGHDGLNVHAVMRATVMLALL